MRAGQKGTPYRAKKRVPAAAVLLLLAGFAWMMAEPVLRALPENDLWWMMPAMSAYTGGRSTAEVFSYLFGALPIGFAQPILKLYLFGVGALMGPEVRWLILVSVFGHLANAALLNLLARGLGLARREAWAASLLYLCLFAHFHAVLWTSASQHLFALTTILLLLVLYLRTEARIARGAPSAGMYAAFVAAVLAASLQRSAFFALALIGAHILFCSRDGEERARRYIRWLLPLGCAYFLYQAWVVTQVGDPVVTEALRKMPFPAAAKPYFVVDPIEPNPISPWVRTAAVWITGTAGLCLGVVLLRVAGKKMAPRRGRQRRGAALLPSPRSQAALAALVCVGVWVYWSRQDTRQILLPYNLVTPLLAALASTLEPVRAAFSVSSAQACHYLPAQVSPWSLLLLLGAGWFFWKRLLPRGRALILLPCWLLLFTPLTIHQVSSFPAQTPSRYFIYISPVVCILLAAMIVACIDPVGAGRRRWSPVRDLLLWGLVLVLGLSNLAAIRVAVFRGRLANTYLSYDDIRIVRLIEEDLRAAPVPAGRIGQIYISGVAPMPIRETWSDVSLAVPTDYDNLSTMARALSGDSRIRGFHPGQPIPQGSEPAYRVEGDRLLRADGKDADLSRRQMEQGLQALKEGREEEARRWLLAAAQTRPFLFRYLLGPLRLLDLIWLTDGLDLQDWLNRVEEGYRQPGSASTVKARQVRAVTSRDLSDFVLCLALISYLDGRAGDKARSQYWLSQVQLLDRNPKRVIARLEAYPIVHADPRIRQFLQEQVGDPLCFIEPFFGKKEDYAFGRFLVRLVFHRDIRSSWDKRFSTVL